MNKTLVVNLIGGPGVAKSTLSAGIFSRLKLKGINSELVTEYAKDVVWEESFTKLNNQIYVFGQQHQRIFRLLGKVDVIITDSPLLMQLTYAKDLPLLNQLIIDEHNKLNNLDILLVRHKEYNPKGRMQTFEEALLKDKEIKEVFDKHAPNYITMDGLEESINEIVKLVEGKLLKQ